MFYIWNTRHLSLTEAWKMERREMVLDAFLTIILHIANYVSVVAVLGRI